MVHMDEADDLMDDLGEEFGMGEDCQFNLVWWDIGDKAKGVILCDGNSQLELFANTMISHTQQLR